MCSSDLSSEAQPAMRAELLDRLHGNILDVFGEHGVQITSPHYMTDPRERQVPEGSGSPPPAPPPS